MFVQKKSVCNKLAGIACEITERLVMFFLTGRDPHLYGGLDCAFYVEERSGP